MGDFDSTEWQVLDRETDLQYGARNVGGTVHWFRIMDFPESDIVKAFAAFLEVDLSGGPAGFIEELDTAESLGMHTAKRDAVWRTEIRGVNLSRTTSGYTVRQMPLKSLSDHSLYSQARPRGLQVFYWCRLQRRVITEQILSARSRD